VWIDLPTRRLRFDRTLAFSAILVALASLNGCGKGKSEIVLAIETDIAAPNPLNRVTLDLYRDGQESAFSAAVIQPGPATSPSQNLPATISVYSNDKIAHHIYAVLRGYDVAGLIVRRTSGFDLLPGERRALLLGLSKTCIGVECTKGWTCMQGACLPEDENSAEFPDYRPEFERGPLCRGESVFLDTRTGAMLAATEDCSAGKACLDGMCRSLRQSTTPMRDGGTDRPEERVDANTDVLEHSDGSILDQGAGLDADVTVPPGSRDNGRQCDRPSQCSTGFCAHGVCCDTACDGVCFACNLAASAGTCSPMPAGQDLWDQCPMDPETSCARTGACDGNGACSRYSSGTWCAAGGCAGRTKQQPSRCDGAGVCAPGPITQDPCVGGCASSADCTVGNVCEEGSCGKPTHLAIGNSCRSDDECATRFCADGFCCDTRCGVACYACNLPGTIGKCRPVSAGEDPANQCPAEDPLTCGRVGGCNGHGLCALQPASTICGEARSCLLGECVSTPLVPDGAP
jgi:hypothetical protein